MVLVTSTGSSFSGKEVHALDRVVFNSSAIGPVVGFADVLSSTGIMQISIWIPGTPGNPTSMPSTTDIAFVKDVNGDPTGEDIPYDAGGTTYDTWRFAP